MRASAGCRRREAQNIPLFCSDQKSNATEYCNVDALILLGGRIKVIVEIEESGRKPTHIFGKFLASAAASCYIHEADGGTPIYKDDDVLFVQVMDTTRLKPRSSKKRQWANIGSSIRSLLPMRSVRRYRLLAGDGNDFTPGQQAATSFVECVTAVLIAEVRVPDEACAAVPPA